MVELPRGHFQCRLRASCSPADDGAAHADTSGGTRVRPPLASRVSHPNDLLRLVGHRTGVTTNGFQLQFDSEKYNSDPVSSYL